MTMLLEVEGLSAAYGPTRVLHDVGFTVEEGAITVLLGANGAGKTTTLRALTGMIRPRGAIRFKGRELAGMAPEAIARCGLAHVPDNRGTFMGMSTEENLHLGAYSRHDTATVRQDIQRIYELFPRLGERRHQQAGTLSGGEQQMLAISRALMMRPTLMLLDEPSFGVAPLVVKEIFELLKTVNRDQNVSMLVVEQNARLSLSVAHHAYLLETGRVVVSGSAAQMRENETVRHSYLGY
jgi:branched-chain amino acid transport system ATP-binding protein